MFNALIFFLSRDKVLQNAYYPINSADRCCVYKQQERQQIG